MKRIVELLAEDAVWEMPRTLRYEGPAASGTLIETHCPAEGPGTRSWCQPPQTASPLSRVHEAA